MAQVYVPDPSQPVISKIRQAVENKTWCMIEDITVTYDTCRCIVGVYDAMKTANKIKFIGYDIEKQIRIAFRIYYMVRSTQ